MKNKILMGIHLVSLAAIAGSSFAEGMYGGQFAAFPLQPIIAFAALIAVIVTRKPTIGVIVAAWLALGPVVMPFVASNLSSGGFGLIVSTVVYLVAIAVALASGGWAMLLRRRSGGSATTEVRPR